MGKIHALKIPDAGYAQLLIDLGGVDKFVDAVEPA